MGDSGGAPFSILIIVLLLISAVVPASAAVSRPEEPQSQPNLMGSTLSEEIKSPKDNDNVTVHEIVLITGDVVRVFATPDGRKNFAVEPADPTKLGQHFQIFQIDNQTYVVPSDVDFSKLDMELFNIDYLIEEGYDNLPDLPVLITYKPGSSQQKVQTIEKSVKIFDRSMEPYPNFSMMAAKLPTENIKKSYESLMNQDIEKIWLDRKVRVNLSESVPLIGAPTLWENGYDGTGIKIAILDTGIDNTHPALDDLDDNENTYDPKVVVQVDFTDDPMYGYEYAKDYYGHGTHCAGIAAGTRPENMKLPISDGSRTVVDKSYPTPIYSKLRIVVDDTERNDEIYYEYDFTLVTDENIEYTVSGRSDIVIGDIIDNVLFYDDDKDGKLDLFKSIYLYAYSSDYDTLAVMVEAWDGTSWTLLYGGPGVGVAPGAYLWNVKVLNRWGWGDWSWVISGIEYATYGPDNLPNTGDEADIISMSIGDGGTDGTDPLSIACDTAVDQGIVVVVAAGNDYDYFTIGTPGVARKVITVGASDKQDSLAYFSSKGPTIDLRVKPDVLAPGVDITSCVPYEFYGRYYLPADGTSMSTPHVAGAAALMLQKGVPSGWSKPEYVKDVMISTAVDLSTTGDRPPIIAAQKIASGAVVAGGVATTCGNGQWNHPENPAAHLDYLLDATFQWMVPGATKVLWYEGYNVYNNTGQCSELVAALEALGYTITGDSTEPITSSLLSPYDILVIPQLQLGTLGTGGDPDLLPDAEVQAIKSFVEGGGGLLIIERSDYGGYNYSKVQNKILAGLGVNFRFQDDEVQDDTSNWYAPWLPIVDVDATTSIGSAYQSATGKTEIGLFEVCSLVLDGGATIIVRGKNTAHNVNYTGAPPVAWYKQEVMYDVYEQGGGRIDIAKAATTDIVIDPATISLFTDNTGDNEILTFYNLDEVDHALGLSAHLIDILSSTDASSAVLLSENSITVPAIGEITVTLNVDKNALPQKSIYSGRITATIDNGPETVHAIFGFTNFNRVTVTKICMDGEPAAFDSVWLLPEKYFYMPVFRLSGTTDVNGLITFYTFDENFAVFSWGSEESTDAPVFTIIENVEITSDVDLTLDERATVPISLDANKPNQITASRYNGTIFEGEDYSHQWTWLEYYPLSPASYISQTSFDTGFIYSYYPEEDFKPTNPDVIDTSEWHKLLFTRDDITGPTQFVPDYDNLVQKTTDYKVGMTPAVGAWFTQFASRYPWGGWTYGWQMNLPQSRAEYLSPETYYDTYLEKYVDRPGVWTPYWGYYGWDYWSAGTKTYEAWNSHPLRTYFSPWLSYNNLYIEANFFRDAYAHRFYNWERYPAGRIRVFRDSVQIYDGYWGDGDVWLSFYDEPVPSDYRVIMEGWSGQYLSTTSHTEFEFNTGEEDYSPPLLYMKILNSDLRNVVQQSPAKVNLIVEDESPIASVALWASFDNGATWESVSLVQVENEVWSANIFASENAYVSLIANVTDASGNSTSQTTIAGFYLIGAVQFWDALITATSSQRSDDAIFSVGPDATAGFDPAYDLPEPPPPVEPPYVQAFFHYPGAPFPRLHRSCIPPGAIMQWPLRVSYRDGMENITLSWNLENVPPDYVVLLFEGENLVADMRAVENYTFEAASGDHDFKVVVGAFVSFTLELTQGWNMISLPVVPENPDPDVIFGDAYYVMYRWDAESRRYVIHADSGSFVEPDPNVEAGVGYWIYSLENRDVMILGIPLTQLTLNLRTGWNMVGSLYRKSSIADPKDDPDGFVLTWAFTWDANGRRYTMSQLLEPGKGHWIYALGDCSLVLSISKLAIVYDIGGRGDLSFNDMAYMGGRRAEQELDVELVEMPSMTEADYVPNLRAAAEDPDTVLIVGVGYLLSEALAEVAQEFPDKNFMGIDTYARSLTPGPLPNLVDVVFEEHNGSALVGVLGALLATHYNYPHIGAVLGIEIPFLWKFEIGYKWGCDWAMGWYENNFPENYAAEPDNSIVKTPKKERVLWDYTGTFTDITKGYEAAKPMYEKGAIAVYNIAGPLGLGINQAVKEIAEAENLEDGPPFWIGVDVDQDWINPGFVIASMMKRVDYGVYYATELVLGNKFRDAVQEYDGEIKLGIGTEILGIPMEGISVSTLDDLDAFLEIGIQAGIIDPEDRDAIYAKVRAMREAQPYWIWEAVGELENRIRIDLENVPEVDTPEEIEYWRGILG